MLPYLLDKWNDAMGKGPISIQMWVPSGTDTYQKHNFPVEELTKKTSNFADLTSEQVAYFLQNQPKTVVR
eukprot:6754223-Ditylum_brightwellii.AAC.1